jgi:alginate O-acetyltransferase complex protein AlgI
MNFSEARFWELLFAALVLVLIGRFASARIGGSVELYDKSALFLLGVFLLGCVSVITVTIFLAVAIGTYIGVAWITRKPPRQRFKYLLILIPLQLVPLIYFKYADFIANRVLDIGVEGLREMVIPVGISFYTFQKVAFVLDTLHFQKPVPRFLDYLNFAGFFPQIVAGPIERRESLLPQMEAFRFRWVPRGIDEGATWIAVGMFFKCCLADNLALFFDATSSTNPYLIWMTNLTFGLRIYYDFAGYSLVALGIGACLGVRLTLNFASPYSAANATDFWRRWHITLSQWFRDYLYIPLGGARVRWWALNVLLVFAISGIWHGAGWNFLWWGLMHGMLLIVHRTLGRRIRIPRVGGWTLTMLAVFAAWMCFYETRPGMLVPKFQTLLTPSAYSFAALKEAATHWGGPDLLVLASTLALCGVVLLLEWRSLKRGEPYAFLRKPMVAALLVALTIILSPSRQNDFIYFAF